MFDFRDLQCFMTIVEQRGFGRAAVALRMTQPALSRRIAAS
jgi:DNA-binding transcriptional LysR family regulator